MERHDRTEVELRTLVSAGSAVLDLGVGDGYYYRSLMKDYKMFGVEISKAMIDSYEFNASNICQCDLNETFPDFGIVFDAVIASMLFHHIDSPAKLAKNIASVLKPGGWLLVACPNIWHLKNRLRVLRGDSPEFSPAHRNFLTPDQLIAVIKDAGFQWKKLLPGRPSENGGLAWLLPRLGAAQLIIVFQKITPKKNLG